MKKRRILICLVAGMLTLAISATAAFGSVNGYARYKQAVKDLLLQEENFTVQAQVKLTVDGDEAGAVQMDYAKDGDNSAYHSQQQTDGKLYQEYSTTLNGTRTRFLSGSNYYTEEPIEPGSFLNDVLGERLDEELEDRLTDFAETAADLVVGGLKNNVVQLAREEGETLYQVQVARNQVPGLVNAGLSALSCYSVREPVQRYMDYEEDYIALLLACYERASGETLSQEEKAAYRKDCCEDIRQQGYGGLLERINRFANSDWYAAYAALEAEKDQGVLYLKNDGSYVDYDTVNAFLADHPQRKGDYLDYYVGSDVAVKDVSCTFRIDEAGKLTANRFQVNLNTIDSAGGRHTIQMDIDLTLTGYGTTTVAPLDVGDRVERT
ncbi:MAG: hypothetical protein MR419_05035 [Clostridiales bacterium]|nr:hypothetical protein [Clostridiales bacterium]MDY4171633.1 hypothetical protein [Evtepia sp.]